MTDLSKQIAEEARPDKILAIFLSGTVIAIILAIVL